MTSPATWNAPARIGKVPRTQPGRLRPWAKYAIVAALTCPLVVSCAGAETDNNAAQSSTTTAATKEFESPAAPLAKLTNPGTHCFATPLDAAAAAGRIAASFIADRVDYESKRRVADHGGPLPPAMANVMGEVSDPDANHCIAVSTFRYEDRWYPPS